MGLVPGRGISIMRDWEIAGAYFLPRILCWRTRNKTLPGKLHKPNLRYLSLSEDARWTLWRSSDYFYPEMIPEPDYSDSGDEAGSEDEDAQMRIPDSRPALERLRDLTEVYVSDVNTKKKTPRKPSGKQAASTSKTAPKQAPKVAAKVPKKTSKPPADVSSIAAKKSKSPERRPKDTDELKTESPRKNKGGRKTTYATESTEIAAPLVEAKATKTKSPAAAAKTPGRKTKPSATKASGDDAAKAKTTDPDLVDKTASGKSSATEHSSDEDQLIKPKKPYAPSTEKQKLHKELKFSQKYGKLAPSKTELQLALERYTENKIRKEMDAEEKGSLEKILAYQAKKIEMQEVMDKYPAWMERLQKPPSTWPNPKTEEFYRVHARVVSSNILTHCFLPENNEDGLQQCCSSLSKASLHSDSDS